MNPPLYNTIACLLSNVDQCRLYTCSKLLWASGLVKLSMGWALDESLSNLSMKLLKIVYSSSHLDPVVCSGGLTLPVSCEETTTREWSREFFFAFVHFVQSHVGTDLRMASGRDALNVVKLKERTLRQFFFYYHHHITSDHSCRCLILWLPRNCFWAEALPLSDCQKFLFGSFRSVWKLVWSTHPLDIFLSCLHSWLHSKLEEEVWLFDHLLYEFILCKFIESFMTCNLYYSRFNFPNGSAQPSRTASKELRISEMTVVGFPQHDVPVPVLCFFLFLKYIFFVDFVRQGQPWHGYSGMWRYARSFCQASESELH